MLKVNINDISYSHKSHLPCLLALLQTLHMARNLLQATLSFCLILSKQENALNHIYRRKRDSDIKHVVTYHL